MDTRRDPGQYYPGGKVISTLPVATDGDVKHSDFEDLNVKTNTLPELRAAVKGLAARLGATVVTALAVCAAIGAEVQTAKFNELDFDADPQVVTNVTFEGLSESSNVYTKAETEAKIVELAPAPGNYSVVSNRAMNAVQTETDPVWNTEKNGYATKDDLTNKVDKSGVQTGSCFIGFTDEGIFVRDMGTGKGTMLTSGIMARQTGTGEVFYYAYPNSSGTFALASDIPSTNGFLKVETDPTVPAWAKAATKPGYTAAEVGAATTEDVYRLVAGTNVILVVTNYNSAAHAPSMKLQRLDPETGEYVTYWDETRRHGLTLTNAMDYTDRATNELARTKADRAWGKYTSAYGVDAPAGVTWLSEEQTVFAAGHDFAKTVTSGGEIFTLVSTGLMLSNVECPTNAAFWQITANGETLYRIEKTSSRVVDVSVNAVSVADPYLLVDLTGWMYPDHPLARVRPDLKEGDWLNEEDYEGGVIPGVAAVTWLGTGAAGDPYICQIENLSGGGQMFAGFWYEAPGETKIIPNGVTDVSGGKWYNGAKYVPTVSGNELKFIRQQ